MIFHTALEALTPEKILKSLRETLRDLELVCYRVPAKLPAVTINLTRAEISAITRKKPLFRVPAQILLRKEPETNSTQIQYVPNREFSWTPETSVRVCVGFRFGSVRNRHYIFPKRNVFCLGPEIGLLIKKKLDFWGNSQNLLQYGRETTLKETPNEKNPHGKQDSTVSPRQGRKR